MIKDIYSYARGTKPDDIRDATQKYKNFFSTRLEYEKYCIFAADMVDAVLMSVEVESPFNYIPTVDMAYYIWKAHVTPHIIFAESVFSQLVEKDSEPDEATIEKRQADDNKVVAAYKVKKENN